MLCPAPENQRRVISVNCMEMNHARVGEGGVLWSGEGEKERSKGEAKDISDGRIWKEEMKVVVKGMVEGE